MKKVFCMSLREFRSGKDTYYVATISSAYGFIQDVFINDKLYDDLYDKIDEVGFVDVTDYFHLQYDKKLDKLVYSLNK